MSEIQTIADGNTVKYFLVIIGILVGLVNTLGFIVLKGITKSIADLWAKVNRDHDQLQQLTTEQNIYHKLKK